MHLYSFIAQKLKAIASNEERENFHKRQWSYQLFQGLKESAEISASQQRRYEEYALTHRTVLKEALKEHLPSGSGFDSGVSLIWEKSSEKILCLQANFHHMNSNGFYSGWTHHVVKITPLFDGIDLKISGRDKNGIKEYIADTLYECLFMEVDYEGNKANG